MLEDTAHRSRLPSAPHRVSELSGWLRVLQLRIVSPSDQTDATLALLRDEAGAATLSVERGGAIRPTGDVVVCDLADERAHSVIDSLRALGIERRGAITLTAIDVIVSAAGRDAERAAPGQGADSLLWERIEEQGREQATLSVTFLVLMAIAAVIATVGIAVDSAVLIIGAMIVGPEFGPLAGVAIGAYRRRRFTSRAALTLALGLLAAAGAATVTAAVAVAVGVSDASFAPDDRFFTAFVTEPNGWSVVVAFAAGIAGMIALGQGRSTALPGVLVSVTTIPAAAAIGVDVVLGDGDDLWHAALQLALNLVSLAAAGVVTLAVHDRWWAIATPPRRRRVLP